MTKDYKELVVEAEKAVASVADPALKQIAFQKILDDLLNGSGPRPHTKDRDTKSKSTSRTAKKTSTRSGPTAYVEELIADEFFANKKSPSDVLTELADRGHHIEATDARVVLLRLCKAKKLRRKKENKTYLYSNW